ncbi:MAG: hypothetical protein KC503_30350 [Myxococcales bacterium]|nr:hypothetical protein [Myxococcales bacterium]
MPRRAVTLTLLATIFCALCVASIPARARAYCLRRVKGRAGHPSWPARSVSFYISSSLVEISKRLAVEDAFAAWSNVPCAALALRSAGSFELAESLDSAQGLESAQGSGIYVHWHTSAQSWPLARHDVVATSTIRVGKDGIARGDIAINAFSYRWSTDGAPATLDVQGELTALVGRVLGLASSDSDDSVMADAMTFADVRKRDLRADDQAALRVLYADPSCAPPPPPGPDGCGVPLAEETTAKRLVSSGEPCPFGCGEGEVCGGEGQCVAAGRAADAAGGCRVGARAAAPPPGALFFALVIGLVVWRRRRRGDGARGRGRHARRARGR